ncbi:hypothetical protein J3R74_002886 [Puniceicoccus vermicola]
MRGGMNSALPCSFLFETVQSHRLVCKHMQHHWGELYSQEKPLP